MSEKKQLVLNLIPPPRVCIHMCVYFVHMYEYIHKYTYEYSRDLFHLERNIESSKANGFELHMPSNKAAGLLFEAIKAIIIIEIGR